MTTRRVLKAGEAIREVVSMAILTEVRDPRVKNVTVTHVEVSPDMKAAKVHVTVMGDDAKKKLALIGLQNSAGFLQKRIAEEIDTRYTPRLAFEMDRGVMHAQQIHKLLAELVPPTMPPPLENSSGESAENVSAVDDSSTAETSDET